jgi:uncharacterized repeat protein (TIGR03803 family)
MHGRDFDKSNSEGADAFSSRPDKVSRRENTALRIYRAAFRFDWIGQRAGKSWRVASMAAHCAMLMAAAPAGATDKPILTVLHSFQGGTSDGASPLAGLIADSAGNLYGTTSLGGGAGCSYEQGCGTLFKLAPDGTGFTVLHSFAGGASGAHPQAGLIADSAGNLYGTTLAGGGGFGTVFRLAPDGTGFTVLRSFSGGTSLGGSPDGESPRAGLIADSAGYLYGTTERAGGAGPFSLGSSGTLFKLAPDGTGFTVLHSFAGGASDGANPQAGLIADSAGNLYGTTASGGNCGSVCPGTGFGTLFKLAPDGTGYKVLHSFAGGTSDGANPQAGLIADSAGNLYGTTSSGGGAGPYSFGSGTLFKLAPDGTGFTVLHSFAGGTSDGANPQAGLIADSAGNLYGTTASGGGTGCLGGAGCGTVFRVAPDGTGYKVLHSFSGGSDGDSPQASLIADATGNLYGTTYKGRGTGCGSRPPGPGCGVVYKLAGTGFVTEKPAALKVTPTTGIVAAAARGGKVFSSSSFDYRLGATTGNVNVAISGLPSWLSPSFTSANVTASSPLTDTFSLVDLQSLARGTYNATIVFTNTTNAQGSTTRSARLRIYNWRDCKRGGWEEFPSPPGPFSAKRQCIAYFFPRLQASSRLGD